MDLNNLVNNDEINKITDIIENKYTYNKKKLLVGFIAKDYIENPELHDGEEKLKKMNNVMKFFIVVLAIFVIMQGIHVYQGDFTSMDAYQNIGGAIAAAIVVYLGYSHSKKEKTPVVDQSKI